MQQISDNHHMMADLRFAAAEMQIMELAAAQAMLDRAEANVDSTSAQRAHRKARQIYRSAVDFLARMRPTPLQLARIHHGLSTLKQKLSDGTRP